MNFKRYVFIVLLVFTSTSSYGSALTIYAADHFYVNDDRLDTTNNENDHYVDLGVSLEDIGGLGLSFHSDAMYSNAHSLVETDGITSASTNLRLPLQLATGYLDWRSAEGKVDLKLGRQLYSNLALETFDFDGLKMSVAPAAHTSFSIGGGLIVPDPIKKTALASFDSGSVLLADLCNSSIPLTTVTGAFAIEKSQHSDNSVRTALGLSFNPMDILSIDGSGRFSTSVDAIDHFDARITLLPSSAFKTSAYFLSEKDRVDSLNYFTIMLHEQLNEFGLLFDYYPEGGGCVQGGYHISSIKNEGADHFFLINAANEALDGGITFGSGFHGLSLRTHGGLKISFGKRITFIGSGEYDLFDETNKKESHHTMIFSGGVRGAFQTIGLTIYPRVEYITNRYYSQDIRFLLTTSLLIHNFWRSE